MPGRSTVELSVTRKAGTAEEGPDRHVEVCQGATTINCIDEDESDGDAPLFTDVAVGAGACLPARVGVPVAVVVTVGITVWIEAGVTEAVSLESVILLAAGTLAGEAVAVRATVDVADGRGEVVAWAIGVAGGKTGVVAVADGAGVEVSHACPARGVAVDVAHAGAAGVVAEAVGVEGSVVAVAVGREGAGVSVATGVPGGTSDTSSKTNESPVL